MKKRLIPLILMLVLALTFSLLITACGDKDGDKDNDDDCDVVGKTFTFQSMTVQDADGNAITDETNEFVSMAKALSQANQGKTVVCNEDGTVRGTVDFGGGSFDELEGDEVYEYVIDGDNVTITVDGEEALSGKLSGNTLTLKMPIMTYVFVLTFTC